MSSDTNCRILEIITQWKIDGLAKSRERKKSVARVRNRILVYPDSDEKDEEYCSLPPLLPCFQTPQPCATFNSIHRNSHNEIDIDNMTLEEYARYELAMSSKKREIDNPTLGFTSQFFNQSQQTLNPPFDKEDSTLDKILDDLFRIRAENLRKIEHEVPHRCDDKTDNESIDISITKEKEEVPMEDVEMDDDVDHSNNNEAL
ncbi:hypothetical protein Tco_1568465 [Tanacetum coccineum]